MQYRPDIDGLRAVAILLVLLFHFSPNALSGGFFGVDVFFVISGYLISGILLVSGYKDFYKKRVLRLFPALLCCMALTYGLGYALLLDSELENLGKHIKSSMAFIENIHLKSEIGYFDASAEAKPLLHLWSLAVEEQFYFLWPVLLLGSRRFIKPIWFIPLALIASLIYCVSLGAASPSKAFYTTGARGWELAIGAMCFVVGHPLSKDAQPRPVNARFVNIVSWLAAATLLASALLYQNAWRHPGLITLVPVLATAALISCGAHAAFNRTVLSLPAVIYTGKISYPLYLFHWPLLAYTYISEGGAPSAAQKVACAATAIIAAALVHHLLERPIHKRARSNWPAPMLAGGALAMWIIGSLTVQAKGLPQRAIVTHNGVLIKSMHLGEGKELTARECGIPSAEMTHLPYCFTDKRHSPTNAVWGDSKAEALYWGLVRASTEQSRWMLVGMYSCAPVLGIHRTSDYSGVSPEQCDKANQLASHALLSNKQIHTVLLVTASRLLEKPRYAPHATSGARESVIQYGLEQSISTLQRSGKRVILLIDNPTIADPLLCVPRLAHQTNDPSGCSEPLATFMQKSASYRQLIQRVARKLSVEVIDPTRSICDLHDGTCRVIQNHESLYSYGDHYSDIGNGIVARDIISYLKDHSATQ
jgi:peptidoglycan/LPS O-acetylase OafA/YrhL